MKECRLPGRIGGLPGRAYRQPGSEQIVYNETKGMIEMSNHVTTTSVHTFHVAVRPCSDVPGYWAKCDAFNGGCTVQGDTLQETQSLMLEAMAFYLEDYPEITNYVLLFEVCDA